MILTNKISLVLIAIIAIAFGIYPFVFYFNNIDFGIIQYKDNALLSNSFWKLNFHIHIVFGAIALSTGWMQFIPKFRDKRINIHRIIGKIYIVSALISAFAGICISFYVTGGIIPFMGFILLGVIWFYTTFMGFFYVKSEEIVLHQKMMIYSYAACFSGVTLRIWLPLLLIIINEFYTAYAIVAWLCWLPNLSFAYLIIRKIEEEGN